ncbi:MAG: N-acetyl-gamma-glutamyl-phosphate reductase [Candidatus Omnitrophota bacterium]|jgi:N-acetyl-gamma-glutamyl-phosphate reductase
MKRAKIVGAGGYGGVGMVELLLQHPEVDIACLVAKDAVGMPISQVYPHLSGYCDLMIHAPDAPEAQEAFDVVFFSTPDRVGMRHAGDELAKGARVIDYSGDFRFNAAEDYADYAGRIGLDTEHVATELLPQSVYGLPELGLAEIGAHDIVGNPGCFAVSCLLGLAPAAQHDLIEPGSLICDCKTGVSGAGKSPKPGFHFPARHDQMNAYRLTGHQHVCEVEQNLSKLSGKEQRITFTAQVVPASRGILSCCYGTLTEGQSRASVMDAYQAFYADRPFVRIFDHKADIGTAQVRGSNYCNLTVDVDERTNRLRVVAHIDNLMKGQAGSALQNMNLLFGFPEKTGLDRPGQYP